MWDLQIANPLGSISWRKLFVIATSLIVTVFAYLILASPTVHAASDVTHQGGDLVYNNNTYTGPTKATGQESYNLPADTQIYAYVEPATGTSGSQKVHFIYFDPTVDVSKATSAKYVEYVYVPPSSYSQPSNQKDLSVDTTATSSSASSCVVPGGMGWIICPLSNTLANGMDLIYGFISDFMKTQPLQTSQQDTLYQAWSLIRNLANIIFVIGFIIIIYSQLTSFGISNYGIKKMLPRLIIAAILVNISYYICAIAVDLSNILGTSTHDLIYSLRDNIFNHTTGRVNDARVFSWSSIVGFILSGGALVGAGIAGAHIAVIGIGGSLVAMIYFVLPMLLGIFLTVLVILLILAARQALIVCLIIISPLAFVAYLLPGTEKWFDKWREVFITMLIFFPAFSLVFSGAQLAGSLIIQNNSSINMILLGLAVQVAPLIITPLLLKLSGRVLGTIAGMINNPKKGLLDRTRNWANERGEMHKQKGLGEGTLRKRNVLRRYARYHDNRNRNIKERTANYSAMSDNRYNGTDLHAKQDHIKREVAEQAEIIEKKLELKWNTHVTVDPHAIEQSLELHLLSDRLAKYKAIQERQYNEATQGLSPLHGNGIEGPQTQSMVELLNGAQDVTKELAALSIANQAAKNMQQKMVSEGLSVKLKNDRSNQAEYDASQALLTVAAGNVDPNGRTRAQAYADATLLKIEKEALDNSVQLLNTEAIRAGTTLKEYAKAIVNAEITAKGSSSAEPQQVQAALEAVAQDGDISTLRKVRMSDHFDKQEITELFARNSPTLKAKGGFDLQANPDLAGATPQVMNQSIAGTIGEVTSSHIADVKFGFWKDVSTTIDTILTDARSDPNAMAGLRKTYIATTEALKNKDIRGTITDRLEETIDIHRRLHAEFGDPNRYVNYDDPDNS
jgi:hypothetical protein